MSELETFRREVRDWLQKNAPKSLFGRRDAQAEWSWGGRKDTFASPDHKRWLSIMAERGWTAPGWPAQYGGGGLALEKAQVVTSEIAHLDLPAPLIGFGLTMIGPTLLQYGTEAQKQEFLPPIIQGQIRWCQGYSEPGSGSDLASLSTRAVRDGDHFVLNGQKIWTSCAADSDWMFLLVRTSTEGKKYEGITFLLMDMAWPGVSVRPIPLISGQSEFCETFIESVRVPVENVIGEINGGWGVAKALLGHERSMIGDVMAGTPGQMRSVVVEAARKHLPLDGERIADPVLRHRIVQDEMDDRAFGLLLQRAKDSMKEGHRPGPESSMYKLLSTELNQRRKELLMSILGPQALGWEGPGFSSEELLATREWLRSRGNSIEGGTSEIQLNILAKRVLGLPD
jgi:alkylation response protein AidB-like acyl-CoA dehydrogenase